ncbi:BhlA/UviB family holin-like peptide [Lysinibacillus sp. NPDC098008]|uniref:BhlA/UviB family holin-like peptide n=1 Tax=Lysinibacillus sp. NPDC098008 TaxID=3364146 RepID=UPI003814BD6C
MTLDQLIEVAQSQAVWAVCCIVLVGFILKRVYEQNDKQEERLTNLHDEYRVESKERENKLMEHLAESNEIQRKTAQSLVQVEKSLVSLEQGLNSLDDRVTIIERNSK